jgi:dTDP-4-amino-4,6-dideoxygalactose transaminase
VARIPLLDLAPTHGPQRDELLGVFSAALESGRFIGGPMVDAFEQEYSAFCGTRFCVGVASGTDALRFALIAAGVRPGDTVLTVPLTFIATTEAISQAGARPDFVDVAEGIWTLDPERLRAYLEEGCTPDSRTGRPVSRRTGGPVTAVVPVHLYGQPADMDPIRELAQRYGLAVVEDACQAHGAQYCSKAEGGWQRVGGMGRAAAFSFYPSKNLGALGEAGAITTDDPEVAAACRLLRDHGQTRKYEHAVEGYNGRLDAIQAGLLTVKLRHLAVWNEERRELARRYDELLAGCDDTLVLPTEPSWARGVYHLYVVGVEERDLVQMALAAAGVETGIHYPVPLHLLPAYTHLGYRPGDLPVAEAASRRVLSLPLYPGMEGAQQERVAAALREALNHASRARAAR